MTLGAHSDPILRTLKAGDVVFVEGEPGDNAYVVEQGQVEISFIRKGRPLRLATLGPGEIFGEMALIDDRPRSATATAVTEVELVVIHRQQIQAVITSADPTISLLLDVLLGRFRVMQGRLEWTTDWSKVGDDALLETTVSPEHTTRDPEDWPVNPLRRDALERLKLERELERAVESDEFRLLLQPIVSLQTGLVAGFEALLRWNHAERGFLAPNKFISLAESSQLIRSIDRWVLKTGLSLLHQLEEALADTEYPPPFLSINLSGISFTDDSAFRLLRGLLEESSVDPSRLKIEITEGVLIDNPKVVSVMLDELRSLGVRIALDDFGTGYSSLSYLVGFPITTLKIDRLFVRDMLGDRRTEEVVRAIVSMAHTLGMEVIAEGVERLNELQTLWQMKCEYIQGFLLSRPLPIDEAIHFARRGALITTGPILLDEQGRLLETQLAEKKAMNG